MADEPENHTLQLLRQMRREQVDTASSLAKLIRNSEERVMRDVAALKQDMASLTRQMSTFKDDVGRQMAMLRDDLETTIKMEIGGSLAHLETRLEDRMDERLEAFARDRVPPQP